MFNNNIATVLNDSVKVAETYHEEYKKDIISDIKLISETINDNQSDFITDTNVLKDLLENYVHLKRLSDAVVFIPSKNLILAKNDFSFGLIFDSIPTQILEETNINKPALLEDSSKTKIRAIVKLDNFIYPTYLLIGKYMDEKVISYLSETKKANSSYNLLLKKTHNLQAFSLVSFFGILIALVFTSKFTAKFLAKKLTAPLENIIEVTKSVAEGNLTSKIEKQTTIKELNLFSNSFNIMIEKLDNLQKQIVARSDFIEAILNQIPDGLIVLDENNQTIIQNKAAVNIISLLGNNIFIKQLYELIHDKNNFEKENHINVDERNFLVKITSASLDSDTIQYLITFTDITDHVAYQKNLLWVEVAKRITHEIRNPLTPIILSAERLEEKFMDRFQNPKELESFARYINNIKKHSEDISIIIDEFVQFGKMPKMEVERHDIVSTINSTIVTGQFDKNIQYKFISDFQSLYIKYDNKQISRALLNIFKNSYEALQDNEEKIITIKLYLQEKIITLTISDNGPGFQENLLSRIAEPYITTKAKGSGLGLAIVKKILDDHEWKFRFYNNNGGSIDIDIPKS